MTDGLGNMGSLAGLGGLDAADRLGGGSPDGAAVLGSRLFKVIIHLHSGSNINTSRIGGQHGCKILAILVFVVFWYGWTCKRQPQPWGYYLKSKFITTEFIDHREERNNFGCRCSEQVNSSVIGIVGNKCTRS